jgi:hypothetical protein
MATLDGKIDFLQSQKKLTLLWVLSFLIISLLIIAQSITGKYEDKISEAWGWFISLVLPNLSLMLTVLFAQTSNDVTSPVMVDVTFYRLTFLFSICYLFTLLAIILVAPLTKVSTIDLMTQTKLFLGTFQGILGITLGLFFIKR